MQLTVAQLQAVKADILASGDLSAIPAGEDGSVAIAALYNIPAAVDYWVWRSFVPDREIYEVTTVDGTAWSWTQYIARSQAEREAWRQMVNMAGGFNPSLVNTRAGITDIFSGSGAAPIAQRTHLLTLGRRKASRIEKLLAAGAGTTANPSLMGAEGPITMQDVETARHVA